MVRWYFGRTAFAHWIAAIDGGGSWQTHGFAVARAVALGRSSVGCNGPYQRP
jgi:hypothetical protein